MMFRGTISWKPLSYHTLPSLHPMTGPTVRGHNVQRAQVATSTVVISIAALLEELAE